MNQIVGADGFSIMNNIRLVIVVAIFIAIVVAFFLSRIVRNRGTIKRKYTQNASNVVDDTYSMVLEKNKEEEAAGKGTAESGVVEIGKESVDDLEKIEIDMKDTEDDVTTKLEADIQDVRNEITTKIDGLVSKMEEGEEDIVNKIKNVIDAKVKEALNQSNDRVSEALQTQRHSIISVLEGLTDTLRTEEVPEAITPPEKTESIVEEKVEFEEVNERDLATSDGDKDTLENLAGSLQMEEESVGISFFGESKAADEEKVLPEEIKEKELEIPHEAEEEIKAEEKEPIETIASSGEVEENTPEKSVGEPTDFDIQELLKEESIGFSPFDEPKEAEEEKVEEKVEEREPTEAVNSSEEIEEMELDTAKGEETKEKEQVTGESAEFDIQKFLEELGTPSSDSSEKG